MNTTPTAPRGEADRMTQRQLDQAVGEIVRQVVALTQPRRIFLFGSAATGRFRHDSDLDLLVVVGDNQRPSAVVDYLNTQVRRPSIPCDFLVATTSMLRRHRRNRGLIYRTILQHGREIYAQS